MVRQRFVMPIMACLVAAVVSLFPGSFPNGVARAASPTTITVDGHGYGHGVGLSQWGAYGYAVDQGWTWAQILDHYYGGTVAGTSDVTMMTVRLMALDGSQTVVVHNAPALVIDGISGGPWRAVVARRVSASGYTVWARSDNAVCPGSSDTLVGWTQLTVNQAAVTVRTSTDTSASSNVADLAAVCTPTGTIRSYRGAIRAIADSNGASRTVNEVPTEQYLRSVVASEVSWGWASAGQGRGAQALGAQAVAARSYAIADNRYTYAKTCDSSCQVYAGAAWRSSLVSSYNVVEKTQIDAAVIATSGVVRRTGNTAGPVALTMFSASSGGFTAPTSLGFTPVEDVGDATSLNPNHNWTAAISATQIQASYPSTGTFQELTVTARNGFGDWGGRVNTVQVRGTSGSVSVTGDQFRSALGLKSNWFNIRGAPVDPGCGTRTPPPIVAVPGAAAASDFVPVTAVRLADTRSGLGVPQGTVGAGCTIVVQVASPGTTAAAVNIASIRAATNGYITAYRCGQPRPFTSVLQSVAGQTVAGASVVPLDELGRLCIFTSTAADVIVDVTGTFGPATGLRFEPLNPARLVDTRSSLAVQAGAVLRVRVSGVGAVPTAAVAASMTLHALSATGSGYATVYPCDQSQPVVSSINVGSGQSIANHLEAALSGVGEICVYASVTMHVAVDVTGWYGAGATSRYVASGPVRIVDTRIGQGISSQLSAGVGRTVQVRGQSGVPNAAVALVATTAVVAPLATGYLTVHPCQTPVPSVSMNRFTALVASATVINGRLSAAGTWCVTSSATAHLVIDISGYFTP